MLLLTLSLAILGSSFACSALIVDALYRKNIGRVTIDVLGAKVRWRRTESEMHNLRQLLALIGAGFLGTLAAVENNPVYIGLQLLLVISALLWYPTFGRTDEALKSVEFWKGLIRLAVALCVWLALEYFGLCSGFHRLGVIGLELLACGFIVQTPLPRDFLCFAGGVVLTVYACLGLLWDPTNMLPHAVWAILNTIYSIPGLANLLDTWKKHRVKTA